MDSSRLGGGLGGKKESGQLRFGGRDRPFRKPINLPVVKNDQFREGRGEEGAVSVREDTGTPG